MKFDFCWSLQKQRACKMLRYFPFLTHPLKYSHTQETGWGLKQERKRISYRIGIEERILGENYFCIWVPLINWVIPTLINAFKSSLKQPFCLRIGLCEILRGTNCSVACNWKLKTLVFMKFHCSSDHPFPMDSSNEEQTWHSKGEY
jgi:hypothetical protein